uniref:Regulator of G protein signaling 12a n=1 Tax=Takifugu rubripes TaxID=31033 RepID=A0A674PDJ2_TAKRU
MVGGPSCSRLRSVEIIRGRAGYGFTISGQRPCLLSGIQEGSPADVVGLKQGDQIMAINGTDVSVALHETVVQLIGSCKGPLRIVVHTEGRKMKNPILNDAKFGIVQTNEVYQKTGILRTISDDSNNSSFNLSHAVSLKPRPVSEPDISQWSQHWNPFLEKPKEETRRVGDADNVFTEGEEGNPDWTMLNITLVVGYLSSTELILNTSGSEDDCSKAILERIRQLGTEQTTHTLVMMKIMYDCVRLCDDAGAVLAAFPAENLVLGAVCAEDPRFFCLVTTAHIVNGRLPEDGPLRASCHVFFIDPELGNHEDHVGIAGRFGFECTPDPDTLGCLEFPQTPPDVLHFVTVLYSEMGEAVERLRAKLDAEAHSSSNGDSGFGNASPPEERAERDFPAAIQNHPGAHLPSCPWDYPTSEDVIRINLSKNVRKLNPRNSCSLHSLSESLPGPDSLANLYGGPPQRWFSKPKWQKGQRSKPEPGMVPNHSVSLNNLPPPMSQIPSDRYQTGEAMMLPPREEWTRQFLDQRDKHSKEFKHLFLDFTHVQHRKHYMVTRSCISRRWWGGI